MTETSTPPDDATDVSARALYVLEQAMSGGETLLARLQESAEKAGCTVVRVGTTQEAGEYIQTVARGLKARSVVRSAHDVLDRIGVDAVLSADGVQVVLMAQEGDSDKESQRQSLRGRAAEAGIGITGVDYAIAETGSCVIVPRAGVSRLVSLLPPVHVAVVEAGQVLPSLDDLFLLRRRDFLQGKLGSYMSIISGPSRSADIEYTIVKGVHGPGEVHLVLLEDSLA
ncbi:MAG: lactate utilization protein [Chloroflexi bacterium]|nr:lactate utilization protein [Chloroflexota bacterium]